MLAGDEKGGAWLYSTECNLTPDTGYSLAQQQQLFYPLSIPHIVFIFKDCVAHADIFASPQKSALFDKACVPKTDPCRPNKTPTTKHKREQRISRTLALFTRT